MLLKYIKYSLNKNIQMEKCKIIKIKDINTKTKYLINIMENIILNFPIIYLIVPEYNLFNLITIINLKDLSYLHC